MTRPSGASPSLGRGFGSEATVHRGRSVRKKRRRQTGGRAKVITARPTTSKAGAAEARGARLRQAKGGAPTLPLFETTSMSIVIVNWGGRTSGAHENVKKKSRVSLCVVGFFDLVPPRGAWFGKAGATSLRPYYPEAQTSLLLLDSPRSAWSPIPHSPSLRAVCACVRHDVTDAANPYAPQIKSGCPLVELITRSRSI
ncbi:hypothetical protein THAOC_18951 [Thalassiosira oceanica]|uniref:Uncharacterized protein n=1 Tax=Thalassiosira oceanica TaxID=159749 RepID=K0SI37_THAOC|nr:hypothetical protein THAOC_18951 [Thalassiosira oceanica]|eukprot:EJK60656.1 hypothetical protein THAOC_18951 [Thalassiosira oceanica]